MTSRRAGLGGLGGDDQRLVMQLADDELEGDDRQRALSLVTENEAAGELFRELIVVGDWARESEREAQQHLPVIDITSAVMARAFAPAAVEPLGHQSLGDQGTPHDTGASPIIDFAAQRQRRTARRTQAAAVFAALAVAAAALFVVRSQDQADKIESASRVVNPATPAAEGSGPSSLSVVPPAAVASSDPGALAANTADALNASRAGGAARTDVEVNGVDAREHDVTVFYPQAGDTNASVVVWIEEAQP